MAETNLGRVAIVPKGTYSASVQYYYLDLVYYQGSSYLVHTQPTIGTLPTDTNYFYLAAEGAEVEMRYDSITDYIQWKLITDVTWNNLIQPADFTPTVVQTIGASETDVMSQKAITDIVMVQSTKNLFDKTKVTQGYYQDHEVPTADASYWLSDYIPVGASKTYISTNPFVFLTRFDANKTYVSKIAAVGQRSITTEADTAFIRISAFINTPLDTQQVEIGVISTDYEPFVFEKYYEIDLAKQRALSDTQKMWVRKNTGILIRSTKQLFNKDTITQGYYQVNGTPAVDAGYWLSDYIPVEAGKIYAVSPSFVFSAFFTTEKVFISGSGAAGRIDFTPPANAAYVRVSAMGSVDNIMLQKGSATNEYEPYYVDVYDNGKVSALSPSKKPFEILISDNGAISTQSLRVDKYLALGNSITIIGTPDNTIWWGSWGMAASEASKDYVHLLSEKIKTKYGVNTAFSQKSIVPWEHAPHIYDLTNFDSYFSGDEDLVTIKVGENCAADETTLSTFQADFEALIDYVKIKAPYARILIAGCFWTSAQIDLRMKAAALAKNCTWCMLSHLDIAANRSTIGAQVYGDDLQLHTINDAGVAYHPNDAGMEAIADAIFTLI